MKTSPPGFLRPSVDPDVVMMLCTAGHVDHGKTELVKLLTGCQTDRLREEQERGLTIELGFAPCWIGGELCAGIVDVPGHEKFVRNMVAGVSGIAMTILVIAADDGVMPQTVEHLQIMELLGVRRGVVALTKTDLVDAETLEIRKEEIRAFLGNTALADAPICPLSAMTFEGYPEFHETLAGAIRSIGAVRRGGVFRLPIERVFTRQGFGAVMTGIPVAGGVKTGDKVELVPGGATGRVRGLQRFLRMASEGQSGQCLAVNVPEFSRAAPQRGQVLCRPGWLTAARQIHARLKTVHDLDPPLRHAEQVKLHAGTSEILGKLYLLEDEKELGGGADALASILLEAPLPAAAHDAFILRRPSPARTVGGGTILIASPEPRRISRGRTLEQLREAEAFFSGRAPGDADWERLRVQYHLLHERPEGAGAEAVARAAMILPETATVILKTLANESWLAQLDGGHAIAIERLRQYYAALEARVREAETAGQAVSLSLPDLKKGMDLPAPVWSRLMRDLEAAGLVRAQGGKAVLNRAAGLLSPAERRLAGDIEKIYAETGFKSPRPGELPGMLGAPEAAVAKLFELLVQEGRLFRIAKNVALDRAHLKSAQDCVVEIIEETGKLDSADFKFEIGSSRKYALAVLDWLDERRVTMRIGNDRKLAHEWRDRLLS